MNDFWRLVVDLLMQYLRRWLGPIDPNNSLVPRFGKALEDAAAGLPNPDMTGVGAAPDDLKDFVRKLVTDFINQKFATRTMIRNILLALVDNLPDALIDQLWDSLFRARLLQSPKPVRGPESVGRTVQRDVNPLFAALSAELPS